GASRGLPLALVAGREVEDGDGLLCGVELEALACAVPAAPGAREQLIAGEGGVGAQAQGLEVEAQLAAARRARVEAGEHEHAVVAVAVGEAEQGLVVGRVEGEGAAVGERGVGAADAVELPEDGGDARGVVEAPAAQLVLLAVEVLLAALLAGRGLEQLEGGA